MRFIKTVTTFIMKEFPHPCKEGEVLQVPCLLNTKREFETHTKIPENHTSWDLFKEIKTCTSYDRYK